MMATYHFEADVVVSEWGEADRITTLRGRVGLVHVVSSVNPLAGRVTLALK